MLRSINKTFKDMQEKSIYVYNSYTATEHVNTIYPSLDLSKQVNDARVIGEKKIQIVFKSGFWFCIFNENRPL